MRSTILLGILVLGACSSSSDDSISFHLVGAPIRGGIWGFAFTRAGVPILSTDHAVLRLDGGSWKALPNSDFGPTQIFVDSHDTIYAHGSRLLSGATTWEPFDDGLAKASVPVEASDGTLYITAGFNVYFRAPGDAHWTDVGPGALDWKGYWRGYADSALYADLRGNVWIALGDGTLERVHLADHAKFDPAWPAPRVGLVGIDSASGLLIGATSNYVGKNGFVFSFDPATGTTRALNDGSCKSSGAGEAPFDICGTSAGSPDGGFVYTNTMAPNGDIYQWFSGSNGGSANLQRLRRGESTWVNLADMHDFQVDGPPQMRVNKDGTLFAWAVGYNGVYNAAEGSYIAGTFTAAVYSN